MNAENHITDIRSEGSRIIYILTRVVLYMDLSNRHILMNACFSFQFSYCPLVWMCYSRTTSKKKTDFFNDEQSVFKKLLEKDSSASIHNRKVNIFQLKLLVMGFLYLLSVIHRSAKIIIFTISDTILSFQTSC